MGCAGVEWVVGASVAEHEGHASHGFHADFLHGWLSVNPCVSLWEDNGFSSFEIIVQVHNEGEMSLLAICPVLAGEVGRKRE